MSSPLGMAVRLLASLWIALVGIVGIVGSVGGCASHPPTPSPLPPTFDAAFTPTYEIDHLWIVSSPGAPERIAFERAGFQVAPNVNQHVSQGTSSITVELDNGFLELIYVDDAVPVAPRLEIIKEQFKQRGAWRTSGYSPFGIGIRRLASAPAAFPFPTVKISADWMPEGTFLELLTPREMPRAVRLFVPARPSIGAQADPVDPRTRVHANRTHRIDAARVVAPSADLLPPAARYLADHARVAFDIGPAWLLEVWLDGGAQSTTRDLRPTLPLVIHY